MRISFKTIKTIVIVILITSGFDFRTGILNNRFQTQIFLHVLKNAQGKQTLLIITDYDNGMQK